MTFFQHDLGWYFIEALSWFGMFCLFCCALGVVVGIAVWFKETVIEQTQWYARRMLRQRQERFTRAQAERMQMLASVQNARDSNTAMLVKVEAALPLVPSGDEKYFRGVKSLLQARGRDLAEAAETLSGTLRNAHFDNVLWNVAHDFRW